MNIFELLPEYIVIMFTIESDFKDEVIKMFNEKLAIIEISENTFLRMQKSFIASIILEYEDVEFVNSIIQSEIIFYDKIIDNLKEQYESINYDDVINFNKLLNFKEKSILILNPLEK